jgi:trehalose 6-phosphate synthase
MSILLPKSIPSPSVTGDRRWRIESTPEPNLSAPDRPVPPVQPWTAARLHELIDARLRGWKVIVVSNREPYMHRRTGDGIECVTTAGGLATALRPILEASGGTWIAHGAGDADRETADPSGRLAVPPAQPAYTLRRVWLTPEQEQGYYYGLANEGLWPLCHTAFQRPVFRLPDWERYREVNQRFADAVLDEAGDTPTFVFIQDYHFCLLPRLLKEAARSRMIIAQFWHIPWPGRETFRIFPWGEELLHGLTGNDLLGFHIRHHCQNFLETVDRNIEARVDREHWSIARGGRETMVRPFPISIDFTGQESLARSPEVAAAMLAWRQRLGLSADVVIGAGVERMDYTKGIADRLRAIDLFFEKHPAWRGKMSFVQIAAPSRSELRAYRDAEREACELAEHITTRWATPGWKPVHLLNRHHGPVDLTALLRLASFMVINPLHDGMNLVAKEYCASRFDEDGVLILSRFTGAHRELRESLGVNPYATHEIADAIHEALLMDPAERTRRMARMRETIRTHNVYRWAGKIIANLLHFDLPDESGPDPEPLD